MTNSPPTDDVRSSTYVRPSVRRSTSALALLISMQPYMLLGLLLVDLQDHDDDNKALVAGNKVLQGMDKEELVFQAIAYGESARRSESKVGSLKHILPLQAVLDDMWYGVLADVVVIQ